MHVLAAICMLINTCIFCTDVNTLPVDPSRQSIDITTRSHSFDMTKNNHVDVHELLESVYKIKEQNGQSKVSGDKQYHRKFIANINNRYLRT